MYLITHIRVICRVLCRSDLSFGEHIRVVCGGEAGTKTSVKAGTNTKLQTNTNNWEDETAALRLRIKVNKAHWSKKKPPGGFRPGLGALFIPLQIDRQALQLRLP